MLTYDLTKNSKPLYENLYRCIKNDILNKVIAANEKLPSKRKFASHLGISVITIENAYSQLLAEGYIHSFPKKGYFVSESIDFPETQNTLQKKEVSLKKETELPFALNNIKYDLTSASLINNLFPFSVWSKLMRQVISEQGPKLLKKEENIGSLALRAAISKHLLNFSGISVNPSQIIVGAGTEYLYTLLIQLFGLDNTFGLEDPGYKKIGKIYASNHIKTEYIPLDKDGLNLEELKKSSVNIVHISPAHHFPTGIVLPIKRRLNLLKWANESPDRFIIEDDYDSEFRFKGKPIQPLQSIDTNDKVIYMNTFSQSIAPSIRISYMIMPLPILELYYQKIGFYSSTVSSFEQYTLAKFISEGYYERHINRMKNYYKRKRNAIISTLKKSNIAKIATIEGNSSGLNFLIKLDTNLSDETLTKLALKKGLKISFLSEYYKHQENKVEHIIVINYSGLEEKDIPKIIEILETILA